MCSVDSGVGGQGTFQTGFDKRRKTEVDIGGFRGSKVFNFQLGKLCPDEVDIVQNCTVKTFSPGHFLGPNRILAQADYLRCNSVDRDRAA